MILLLRHRLPGWPAFVQLHLVLVALLVSLVLAARRFPAAHAWYPLMMPLVTFPEVAHLNHLFVDAWQDHRLLAFEAWVFPEPPTVWLRRFASPLVTEILQAGYLSYFVLLLIVAGVLRRRADQGQFHGVIAASVLSYLLCYGVFVLVPMEGPVHTLRHLNSIPITGGPFHAAVTFVQRAGVHGNAFPSAHVAGAMPPLLFAWRYAPRLAAWLTPFVVLLCIGAVYDWYHYASDVMAGILVGTAASWLVMAIQRRPAWARRLNLFPAP